MIKKWTDADIAKEKKSFTRKHIQSVTDMNIKYDLPYFILLLISE